MQFDRSALISAIDKAIAQEREALDVVNTQNKADNVRHQQEWIDLHREAWMKATASIRAKLRKGEPVDEHDIPRDRSGVSVKAFYRPRRTQALPTVHTTELAGLRAVLDAVVDDQISSAGLRSLGVGVNTLRMLVPLLGSATVRGERAKKVS